MCQTGRLEATRHVGELAWPYHTTFVACLILGSTSTPVLQQYETLADDELLKERMKRH
jgi:hypothetical protein